MPKFYVNFKMTSRYIAEVEAKNIETAKKEAARMFSEADFGEASDIDGDVIYIENENGDRLSET